MFKFTDNDDYGDVLSDDFLPNAFSNKEKPNNVQVKARISTLSQEPETTKPSEVRIDQTKGNPDLTPASSITIPDTRTKRSYKTTPQGSGKKFISEKTSIQSHRIPGPAGYLSNIFPQGTPPAHLLTKNVNDVLAIRSNETPKSSNKKLTLSQFCNKKDDSKEAWETMMNALGLSQNSNELTDKYNIAWVQHKASIKQLPKGKVPILAVTIKTVLEKVPGATSIIFKDATGEMLGTIYWGVLGDLQDKLQPGSACCFKKVSVFSPNSVKHYLNVTHENILCMYQQSTGNNIFISQGNNLRERVKVCLKDDHQCDTSSSHLGARSSSHGGEPRRQLFNSKPDSGCTGARKSPVFTDSNISSVGKLPVFVQSNLSSTKRLPVFKTVTPSVQNQEDDDWPIEDDNMDELLSSLPEKQLETPTGSTSTHLENSKPSCGRDKSFWPIDDDDDDDDLDSLLGSLPSAHLF